MGAKLGEVLGELGDPVGAKRDPTNGDRPNCHSRDRQPERLTDREPIYSIRSKREITRISSRDDNDPQSGGEIAVDGERGRE